MSSGANGAGNVKLTVVGSVNVDLVVRVARLPRPGETLAGLGYERLPGGKGANQALAAARLGASVTLIGAVGDDRLAGVALTELVAAGVRLDLERVGETGVAMHGATDRPWRHQCVGSRHNHDLIFAAVIYEDVAVTCGAEGASLFDGGKEVARAAAPTVEAVDGTAAGDAIAACLVVSILEGRQHAEALHRACAAGALAATRLGAQAYPRELSSTSSWITRRSGPLRL